LPADAEASETNQSGRVSIVVRTYGQAESNADVPTARRAAGAILGRAGIDVSWLECTVLPENANAADACDVPPGSNELVLRIVRVGADAASHINTLGVAFVDPAAGGGTLATVYADRVTQMAQRAGVDETELMGRAIAHEIGHLLLGTNQHARQGLMRASWSGADLRRNRVIEWLFDGRESEMMRRGIARRSDLPQ
jgi:hypothetical protein